jgi:hypothetical protein
VHLAAMKPQNAPGNLIHLDAMGTHFIIINDINVAKELLDKRSAIYSDRPELAMAGELCGWSRTLILTHYNEERFKDLRTCFFKMFGTKQSIERLHPIFEEEAQLLMKRLVAHPNELFLYVRKCVSFCLTGS